jgi:phosphatidate phosphatase LPIN
MAVLKDIRSLFPADHNPFHAGFGNRETDAIAYRSVGISLDKVFIVNPKGHIHHHCISDNLVKSYAIINTMLKEIFPGLSKDIQVPESNILRINSESTLQANVQKVVA